MSLPDPALAVPGAASGASMAAASPGPASPPSPAEAPRSVFYRVLDLDGFARSTTMQWLALGVTAAFVLLEGGYNLDLLNTLIDPTATHEQVQSLSDRGKLLAAIGIAWASGRWLLERVRPALLGLLLLASLAAAVHQGLDHLYTKVIHDLSPEVKLEGFRLFSYRRDLLTGRLSDPDIPVPREDPVAGRLIMGAFPMVMFDERYMLPARDIIERKANDKIRFVMRDASDAWPTYARQMQDLQRAHQEFLDGSRKAYQYKDYGGLDKFRDQSGGMQANPNLNMAGFLDALRVSRHPKAQAFRDAEKRPVAKRPDGTLLLGSELPKFMSHAQYMGWFESQVKQVRDDALPTVATVSAMHGIDDINSAVFLPPMAIMASLTSAITNGLTFILLALGMATRGSAWRPAAVFGRVVTRWGAPLMLGLFALWLLCMPAYVFEPGPMRDLEQTMHERVGWAGRLWSRLANVQRDFVGRELG